MRTGNRLTGSLGSDPDDRVDLASREEIARRVAALDAGEVESIPWEQVRDELWSKLNKAGPRRQL